MRSTAVTATPLPVGSAVAALARCLFRTLMLLSRNRIRVPAGNRGLRLGFADGTSATVFRETVIERPAPRDPCVLVVRFELRAVHGRGHAWFRRESLLNTLLFAGFPGLISKLWLTDDQRGRYRGLYEWDGPESAAAYARALWWVLALVSVPGSIDYHVVPGPHRADLFDAVRRDAAGAGAQWWRVTEIGSLSGG
ncbi:hypothetical protein AB0L82_29380 [Nocardia sp. NPDC052001]|uniref:hypothetical protein n=1 Tax=Nocardia sp. NPDC052001 TaxID=3154853 RepID=UPI00341D9602